MRAIYPSVFKKPEVINELHRLHENFVLVPADKASNNIVFVCKSHYYTCLLNEVEFTSTSGNPTYIPNNIKWRSNKILNVIIVQKTHTKSSVGQHGPSTEAKVGSGAMEE